MRRRSHAIDALFALVLFCAFAASALLVLAAGADVYRDTADTAEERAAGRTGLSYIAAKLRHGDMAGAVSVEDFGGVPALCLRETDGEDAFVTRIYAWEGSLCELYAEEGSGLSPGDGELLLPARSLELSLSGHGLLRAVFVDGTGARASLYLHVRTAGEGAG